MKFKQALILGALCLSCGAVCAQWLWVDKDGRKVYSDSMPPPGTPAQNILKQPGPRVSSAAIAAADVAQPAASAASNPSSALRPSGKNKELEEKRKRTEQAEEDKRHAEDDKQKQVRAENCRRARQAKTSLDSGIRITRSNDKGEIEFLDDAARTAETQRMQEIIRTQCAP
jgi:hypothetical protein